MQTTYRLKAQEISMTFLKSLKSLFAGREVEITIKSVKPEDKNPVKDNHRMAELVEGCQSFAPC